MRENDPPLSLILPALGCDYPLPADDDSRLSPLPECPICHAGPRRSFKVNMQANRWWHYTNDCQPNPDGSFPPRGDGIELVKRTLSLHLDEALNWCEDNGVTVAAKSPTSEPTSERGLFYRGPNDLHGHAYQY